MEVKVKGWVVLTYDHGLTRSQIMIHSSFATTRANSIELFANNSGYKWKYWYKKFNYRCVRATSIISDII